MPARNPQRRFIHISRRFRRYMEDSRPSRMMYGWLLLSAYDRETHSTACRAFKTFNFDLVSENFKAASPVIKSLFRYHCFSSICRQWRILIRMIRPFIIISIPIPQLVGLGPQAQVACERFIFHTSGYMEIVSQKKIWSNALYCVFYMKIERKVETGNGRFPVRRT